MAAPDHVATNPSQAPRRGLPLPPARSWRPDRPGDLRSRQPAGASLGYQGPDQGYALGLAQRLVDRLRLSEGEQVEDVLAGAVAVGLKRASLYGRAPVIHDLTLALTIWGFLGDEETPPGLIGYRRSLFEGAGHRYADQRAIADAVSEEVLRLPLSEIQWRHVSDWKSLLTEE
jgi:hypothetical protein